MGILPVLRRTSGTRHIVGKTVEGPMNINEAVEEALRRIRATDDRAQNGLIIWKVGQEYSVEPSLIGKALKERQTKKEKAMDEKNSIIDIEKVERMARDRGMDLTQMSVSCGLSKDVLRNIRRHPETPSRWTTIQKVADGLGVDPNDIIKTNKPSDDNRILKMLAIWNGISIEEVKERIVKDYIGKLNIQTDAMTLGGME